MLNLQGHKIQNRQSYSKVVCHLRWMVAAIILTVGSIGLFIVAVSTNYWLIVELRGTIRPYPGRPLSNATAFLHIGIWREHQRWDFANGTIQEVWIGHLPRPQYYLNVAEMSQLPHYYRTQAVFSLICLLLMLGSNFSAVYSLRHFRYMYKRLSASLYLIVAMCILIVLEVMIHHVDAWRLNEHAEELNDGKPHMQLDFHYGFSTYLAWGTFGTYILAAIIFAIGSHKQKGAAAATVEFEYEDRPVEIRR